MIPDEFFTAVTEHQIRTSIAAQYAEGMFATTNPKNHKTLDSANKRKMYKAEWMRRKRAQS